MKVIISAATKGEWLQSSEIINTVLAKTNKPLQVIFHAGGVGMLPYAVKLMTCLYHEKPDLVIQTGIAGSFNNDMQLGKVVVVANEILGDTGVEENAGWKDLFDMQLKQPNDSPFINCSLPNLQLKQFNLLGMDTVTGLTVNEISTSQQRIEQLKEKYAPDIESMEGAALHFVCTEMNIPFIQIRAISNYVGERNKANWQMKEALTMLNETILLYLECLLTKYCPD